MSKGFTARNIPNKLLGKKTKALWQIQEERLSGISNGRRQFGSGRGPVEKGDIKTDTLLIEAKSTDKQSIALKTSVLKKITEEAISLNRIPALAITFKELPLGVQKDWIMIPAKDFFEENKGE